MLRRATGSLIRMAGIGFAIALLSGASLAASTDINPADRVSITGLMDESAAAWSKNDLAGFMSSYDHSPDTTYVTASKLVRGFNAIRAMYSARFGGTGSLGQLSFSLDEIRPLGADYALGIGGYKLIKPGLAAPLTGIFTLIFRRTREGWKIVCDHTSS